MNETRVWQGHRLWWGCAIAGLLLVCLIMGSALGNAYWPTGVRWPLDRSVSLREPLVWASSFLFLFLSYVAMRYAKVRVRLTSEGIHVQGVFRSRSFGWATIREIRMAPGVGSLWISSEHAKVELGFWVGGIVRLKREIALMAKVYAPQARLASACPSWLLGLRKRCGFLSGRWPDDGTTYSDSDD